MAQNLSTPSMAPIARRLTTQDRLGSVGSYYPYGEAKSGTVSNADSFATYYRDSTGLDYAQNRYYGVAVGRFLTPDPAASGINLYSYASTDPVSSFDPEGLVTVIVSGTSEQNAEWSQPGSPMFNMIRDHFGESDECMFIFDWSTSVSGTVFGDAMRAAAPILDQLIERAIRRCPGQPLNLVGYSHGGNVIIEYLNQPYANYVSNVVTLGTPSRIDFELNASALKRFGNFCAISLDNDGVQFGGAHPVQILSYVFAQMDAWDLFSSAMWRLISGDIWGYFRYIQLWNAALLAGDSFMMGTRWQPNVRNFIYNHGLIPTRSAHTAVRDVEVWRLATAESDWNCR